jgi:hypothetical protein
MKKLFRFMVWSFFFGSSLSYASITVGGLLSMNHVFDKPSDQITWTYRVMDDGGYQSRYYWATQFFTSKKQDGYAGLQNIAGIKKINFSIWNTFSADKKSQARCRTFGHEGSGTQCSMRYDWQENRDYQFQLSLNQGAVSLHVVDMETGISTFVATIHTSNPWNAFQGRINTFAEEFSQGRQQLASCEAMGNSSFMLKDVAMRNSAYQQVRSKTYGNCGHLAMALCAANGTCYGKTGVDYTQQLDQPYKLISALTGMCADNLATKRWVGMWPCDYRDYGNAYTRWDSYEASSQNNPTKPQYNRNQSVTYHSNYTLQVNSSGSNLCMKVNPKGFIYLGRCGPRNTWWYEPVQQRLVYVNRDNTCLAATTDKLGSVFRGATCSNRQRKKFVFEREDG